MPLACVRDLRNARDDTNDPILFEVSVEPGDPERPGDHDEERPPGKPWQVRRHDVQVGESVLIGRTRRGSAGVAGAGRDGSHETAMIYIGHLG